MPTNDDGIAAQVTRRYWKSDVAVARIADELGISRRALYTHLRPEPAGVQCPDCGGGMVYTNRTRRSAGEVECEACGREADVAELRRRTAEAGDRVRERADRLEAVVERPEMGTGRDRRRKRTMLLGGLAVAGAVVGAVAAYLVRRGR